MLKKSYKYKKYIYFDNAATSFPKPEAVIVSVEKFMREIGGNPGRSGHELSIKSGEIIFEAREALSGLFGLKNPMRVIFTSNATEALNLAILGTAREGCHIITTSMEHNSTIRPLKELEKKGIISLSISNCSNHGEIDLNKLTDLISAKTSAIVINHASNVTGTVQKLDEIGKLCREKSITLIADCAQSAGIIPININELNIDMLAFSGHKGLLGPAGTGGLVISDNFDYKKITPLKYGGTGSLSDQITHPDFLPDIFECGTLNTAGIAGLLEGTSFITSLKGGVESVQSHKENLSKYFIENAAARVKGFVSRVPADKIKTGVVSFNIEGVDPAEISSVLSDDYKIMCRAGLHCSPLAHKTIGTYPAGTVRFSFGFFNTAEEIDSAVYALKNISENRS